MAGQPPSQGKMTPLKLEASSEARNVMPAASSSGIATIGMICMDLPRRSGMSFEPSSANRSALAPDAGAGGDGGHVSKALCIWHVALLFFALRPLEATPAIQLLEYSEEQGAEFVQSARVKPGVLISSKEVFSLRRELNEAVHPMKLAQTFQGQLEAAMNARAAAPYLRPVFGRLLAQQGRSNPLFDSGPPDP